jgi:hypothetical protein
LTVTLADCPEQIGPTGENVPVTSGLTVTVTGLLTVVTHAGKFTKETEVSVYVVVAPGVTLTVKGIALMVRGHAMPAPVPFTTHGPVPVSTKLIVAEAPAQIVVAFVPPILIDPPG